jgi:hypothetical protein
VLYSSEAKKQSPSNHRRRKGNQASFILPTIRSAADTLKGNDINKETALISWT